MSGFSADDVVVGSGSKYQAAGVSEKVTFTEIVLVENNGVQSIEIKTINEQGQEGRSKRLSLKTDLAPGKTISGWDMTAKYLINQIMSSTGASVDSAKAILKSDSVSDLKSKLESTLIGKTVRGLFSSREYQPGKFAIALHISEPVGGTRLVWDAKSKYHNELLPVAETSTTPF